MKIAKAFAPTWSWLLLLVLVFQVSDFPEIFEVKTISRAVNALAFFICFVMALRVLIRKKQVNVSIFFVLPAGMVLLGFGANIFRSLNAETLGYVGMLLPWLATLSVPFAESYSLEDSWVLFYRFMLIFSLVACAEYAAVFSGALSPTPIDSSLHAGEFYRGVFTIFYYLNDGTFHDRMYGIFAEPGTFAMLLMPAIAYALVFSKRWALLVFLTCLLLTRSLGGFVCLPVVLALFSTWRARRVPLRTLLVILMCVCAGYYLREFFVDSYVAKGNSAIIRQDNVFLFVENFWNTLLRYPFGSPLEGNSLSRLQDIDAKYLGSDFALYTALILGGIAALVGYVAILAGASFASIKHFRRGVSDKFLACAFISLPALLPFIVQRSTIFDSALFSFLFASPVIAVIRGDAADKVQEIRLIASEAV